MEFINADCMDYLPDFADNYFDLAIVDPPYGVGSGQRKYYGKETALVKQKSGKHLLVNRTEFNPKDWDDKKPSIDYFKELQRISIEQIIWGVNYFRLPVSYKSKGRIVWDKVNPGSDYSDCEIAYSSFHDSVRLFRFMWNGMMQGKGIKNGQIQQGNKKLNEKRIHPTQKPVALYRWLLQNYAKPGDLILDTHAGSGSSLVACIMEGFDYIGYEIDKEYYDGAMKRIIAERKKIDMFKI